MTVGNVAHSPTQLLAADRVSTDARRPDANRRDQESSATSPVATRQEFVLGAAAYRRVLATLESDRSGAFSPHEDGGSYAAIHQSVSYQAVNYQSNTSYTGHRAQRAYQDTTQGNERESLSSLFGVDVFV